MRGSMRRVHVTALISFASALVACDVGLVPPAGARGGDGPDGGAAGSAPDRTGGGADGGAPVEIACDPQVESGESGEHNAGQPCLACHGNGEGPDFSLAGTVYGSLGGGAPVVGATIHVTDADGVEYIAVSARNGNFWLREAITFPVQVRASACPSTQPMIAPSATGNCNAGGCHDADFRIYLP